MRMKRAEKMEPGEARNYTMPLVLSLREREMIREKSASAGLTMSEYLRRCAAGMTVCEVPRPETRELLHLLKQIAGEAENMYLALISTGHVPEADILREMSASCGEAAKAVLESFRPVSPV